MGVQGLWHLLQPCGRPTKLESLEGRRLAIDSSIWLYHFQMAMRDKEGRTLANAHILGFLWRILKMIHFGIRPIFVFDGGAPVLKRKTLSGRKTRRTGARDDHRRVAERLLHARMREAALTHVSKGGPDKGKEAENDEEGGDHGLGEGVVYMDEYTNSPAAGGPSQSREGDAIDDGAISAHRAKEKAMELEAEKKKKRDQWQKDPYALPALQQDISTITADNSAAVRKGRGGGKRPDIRFATEAELRSLLSSIQPTDLDLDSEFFRTLPTEMQYELVGDLRAASRGTSYKRLQAMLAASPTPIDFSRAQIAGLKTRNELTQKVLEVTDEIGDAHIKVPVRVAGARNREYVLIRNKGNQAGFVLGVRDTGTSQEKAIKVDEDTDSATTFDDEVAKNLTDDEDFDLEDVSTQSIPQEDDFEHLPDELRDANPNDPEARKHVARELLERRARQLAKSKDGSEQITMEEDIHEQQSSAPNGKSTQARSLFRHDDIDLEQIGVYDSDEDDLQEEGAQELSNDNRMSTDDEARDEMDTSNWHDAGFNSTNADAELEEEGDDDIELHEVDTLPVEASEYESFYDQNKNSDEATQHQEARDSLSADSTLENESSESRKLDKILVMSALNRRAKRIRSANSSSIGRGRSKPSKITTAQKVDSRAPKSHALDRGTERDRKEATEKRESVKASDYSAALSISSTDSFEDRASEEAIDILSGGEPMPEEDVTHTSKKDDELQEQEVKVVDYRNSDDSKDQLSNLDSEQGGGPDKSLGNSTGSDIAEKKDAANTRKEEQEHSDENVNVVDLVDQSSPILETFEPNNTQGRQHIVTNADPTRMEQSGKDPISTLEEHDSTTLDNIQNFVASDEFTGDASASVTHTRSGSRRVPVFGDDFPGSPEIARRDGDERETRSSEERLFPPADDHDFADESSRVEPKDFVQERVMDADDPSHGEQPVYSPDWSRSPTPQLDEDSVVLGPDGFPLPTAAELEAMEAEDEADLGQLDGDQDEFVSFLSRAKGRGLNEVRREVEDEVNRLRSEHAATRRSEGDVTQQMAKEIQLMLRLFGLPYITAPMEAEAQCAELVSIGLADGIITDDSDVFLFGGTFIYKNMFNNKKYVECYKLSDLQHDLGMDRTKLVQLAYLLGSDYTDGLEGVGPVLAMEIMSSFSGDDALIQFREWWLKVQKGEDTPRDTSNATLKRIKRTLRNKVHLTDQWPDAHVLNAYYEPTVDSSDEPFQWGLPDLDSLRSFFAEYLQWDREKTDHYLVPAIEEQNRLSRKTQSTLDNGTFFDLSAGQGVYAGRQRPGYNSARLQKVITNFRDSNEAAKRKRRSHQNDPEEAVSLSEDEGEAAENIDPTPEHLVGKEMGKSSRPVVARKKSNKAKEIDSVADAGQDTSGHVGGDQNAAPANGKAQKKRSRAKGRNEGVDGEALHPDDEEWQPRKSKAKKRKTGPSEGAAGAIRLSQARSYSLDELDDLPPTRARDLRHSVPTAMQPSTSRDQEAFVVSDEEESDLSD